MIMIHKLHFRDHFHAQYEFFQLFCLDTSLSNRGMLKFKPCYENQVYLAHYIKYKTLPHRGLCEDIGWLHFGAHMANFDISFGFVVSQEMMTSVYVLGSRVAYEIVCKLNGTLIVT